MINKDKRPKVQSVTADNGEHSHFSLINVEDGKILWEEQNDTSASLKWIREKLQKERDMQDTINMEHPEAEKECFEMHGKEIFYLEQIEKQLEKFKRKFNE